MGVGNIGGKVVLVAIDYWYSGFGSIGGILVLGVKVVYRW